jgi:(2Fe-2S) ferredoxin
VIYPSGVWYRVATTEDVEAVLQHHVIERKRAMAQMLPAD